jgi:NADPH:quinone reductase-like Zn-dependent oxidoreductase
MVMLPDPVLQPKHVLVDVRATGVNPVEIAMRSGEFRKYQKYQSRMSWAWTFRESFLR